MQLNELGKANQICDLKRHDLVAVKSKLNQYRKI